MQKLLRPFLIAAFLPTTMLGLLLGPVPASRAGYCGYRGCYGFHGYPGYWRGYPYCGHFGVGFYEAFGFYGPYNYWPYGYYVPYGYAYYPPPPPQAATVSDSSGGDRSAPAASSANRPPPDNAVHLKVLVPAGAEVWFGGNKTTGTSREREFVSPPVNPGTNYDYTVWVQWTDANGKVHNETRVLHVHANDWILVDLTAPAPPEVLPVPKHDELQRNEGKADAPHSLTTN
jgi:uncharacterized protein (TIGR03000 family)